MYDEKIPPVKLFSAAMIFVGIYLVSKKEKIISEKMPQGN
jgi:hypothetical protein